MEWAFEGSDIIEMYFTITLHYARSDQNNNILSMLLPVMMTKVGYKYFDAMMETDHANENVFIPVNYAFA